MTLTLLEADGSGERTVRVADGFDSPWFHVIGFGVADDGGSAVSVTRHYERVSPGRYEFRSWDVSHSDDAESTRA
jgi:hypothetical protein